MIEINLLPESYKAERRTQEHNIPLNLILLASNAVFIAILLIISVVNLSRTITLRALNTRLEGLAPEQQKIIEIQRKTSQFKAKNSLFSPFVSGRFYWSKKLNVLSDLIIPGIWLRDLSFEKNLLSTTGRSSTGQVSFSYSLKINGTAVSIEGDEMSIINDFIKGLKTNPEFFEDFKTIELESILRRRIASVEVMDFALICLFKEGVHP